MSEKRLMTVLKAACVTVGIWAVALYALLLPKLLRDLHAAGWLVPFPYAVFLLFVELTLLPCLLLFYNAWNVIVRIGNGKSFCKENALAFRRMAFSLAGGSLYILIGMIVLLLIDRQNLSVAIVGSLLCVLVFAIAAVFGVISYLIANAAKVVEENELTI